VNKTVTLADAFSGVEDGATVLIAGFGDAGYPFELVDALAETTLTGLTLVSNNAGHTSSGVLRLLRERRIDRIVCSYPIRNEPTLAEALAANELQLDIVPQGTLAERLRAGGAGIPAFFTPTAAGTALGEGKEVRDFDGVACVMETALRGDIALVKATIADRGGNLHYRAASQNFNPVMAMSGRVTIAQAREVVEVGELDPSSIHTPGIFVDRIVQAGAHT